MKGDTVMLWKIIVTLIVGVIAGWLAEKIMKVDMPTWQNLVLGLCGSGVATLIFALVGKEKPAGFIISIILAAVFACLIIWLVNFIKTKTKK